MRVWKRASWTTRYSTTAKPLNSMPSTMYSLATGECWWWCGGVVVMCGGVMSVVICGDVG